MGREPGRVEVVTGPMFAGKTEELTPAGTDLVGIDEAHFFGLELVPVVEELARRGHVVVVAGLDVTFAGLPFEPLPTLMALAERVDKLTAICTVCGEEAVFHQRIAPGSAGATELISEHVGGSEKYEARCRRDFSPNRPLGGVLRDLR